jgi:hypothetical protein
MDTNTENDEIRMARGGIELRGILNNSVHFLFATFVIFCKDIEQKEAKKTKMGSIPRVTDLTSVFRVGLKG